VASLSMNIGETIRSYRLQKGMSQGDIEKRTGLLRCYLSRVENGHTIPSLDTLAKIAGAMELPLSQFFSESGHSNGSKGMPQLSDDEVRFLSQIRRYSVSLNDSDRKLVLAMVKKMAGIINQARALVAGNWTPSVVLPLARKRQMYAEIRPLVPTRVFCNFT